MFFIGGTWWVIGLILSATACTYFINKTWTKWVQNPVIVSFAQEHTSIWEIPFPAVTVCPLNKIKESKFNYSAYYHSAFNESLLEGFWNITENRKRFWDIAFVCSSIRGMDNLENFTDEDIITNIKMVSPTRLDTTTIPQWPKSDYGGDFAEQITSEGLCFTVNALGHNEMYTDQMKEGVYFIEDNWTDTSTKWTIESGYLTSGEASSYPVRIPQAGIAYGLFFNLFSAVLERSIYCCEDVAGYKMVLHNPAEIPRLSESYFLVPVNQKVIVAVTPKVIRTSKNLVDVPPHTRNCYFAHEKKLRFFRIYTQYNCKTECLSNVTRQFCGCVPYYLPRDNNTEICGYGKMECLLLAKDLEFEFLNMANNNKMDLHESDKTEYEIFKQCDCLSSCDYIDYEADISQAEYLYKNLYSTETERKEYELDETPINVFFKESQFLSLERNELYGQTDFIANIGGLLGLCVGFSFLSLLEIVYFITLRVWCKIYQKNKTDVAHNSKTRVVWQD